MVGEWGVGPRPRGNGIDRNQRLTPPDATT